VSCLAVTGETTGIQCWEVHKDAVTGIIEKHIKDPAMIKRLADARNSAVDLGVTTAKASPAQKKKKTDRAIRVARFCSENHQKMASKKAALGGSLLTGRHKDICGVLRKWREAVKDGVAPDSCTAELVAFLQQR